MAASTRLRSLSLSLLTLLATILAIASPATAAAAPTSVGAHPVVAAASVGPGPAASPQTHRATAFVYDAAAVGTVVAAEGGGARFIAASDGTVTDLVGSRNAVSLGHYPDYIRDAQSAGSRTFSMSGDAWAAMSGREQWLRNRGFLDNAIARGSEIRLATPIDAVRPGSFYERELGYLADQGFVPNSAGTRMVRGD